MSIQINRLRVYRNDILVGLLERTEDGFIFTYDTEYLKCPKGPISINLPKRAEPYKSPYLFSNFTLAQGLNEAAILKRTGLKKDQVMERLALLTRQYAKSIAFEMS